MTCGGPNGTLYRRVSPLSSKRLIFLSRPGARVLGADEQAENGKRIVQHIRQFQATHGSSIPALGAQTLAQWMDLMVWRSSAAQITGPFHHLTIIPTPLLVEMNHLLTSVDALGRGLVARAFQHLQRSPPPLHQPALSLRYSGLAGRAFSIERRIVS